MTHLSSVFWLNRVDIADSPDLCVLIKQVDVDDSPELCVLIKQVDADDRFDESHGQPGAQFYSLDL